MKMELLFFWVWLCIPKNLPMFEGKEMSRDVFPSSRIKRDYNDVLELTLIKKGTYLQKQERDIFTKSSAR